MKRGILTTFSGTEILSATTCRVDSVMLLDNGFEVVSVDASDKMLKTAYKIRWDRRKEPSYDKWGETTAHESLLFSH